MSSPAHKVSRFTQSVIRDQTRQAAVHNALNLAQGFPDFDPPEALLQALSSAVRSGHHQYANTWGAPEFRQALADKIRQDSGLEVDADRNLTVTCGSTEAMVASLMACLNPGDKLAVFSPFYENYGADGILSGAETVHIPLHAPDWKFDPQDVRRALQSGCRALVLCNPSNPCGKVFTPQELQTLADLLIEFDAMAVTDEVYEHLVYDGREHVHMAALPGMFDRTLTCSSLSKTYSITGWRLGYVMASPLWTDSVRKVHDFLTVGAAHPLQIAASTALRFPRSYYQDLCSSYQRKRDKFCSALDSIGLPVQRPQGAYFVMVDVAPLGFADDVACAKWLIEKVGVAGVPCSSFFAHSPASMVRFHFSRQEATLDQAIERLSRIPQLI